MYIYLKFYLFNKNIAFFEIHNFEVKFLTDDRKIMSI